MTVAQTLNVKHNDHTYTSDEVHIWLAIPISTSFSIRASLLTRCKRTERCIGCNKEKYNDSEVVGQHEMARCECPGPPVGYPEWPQYARLMRRSIPRDSIAVLCIRNLLALAILCMIYL